VRHAAGEVADRLHLLRLAKLRLDRVLPRHVLEDVDDGTDMPACRVHGSAGETNVEGSAIAVGTVNQHPTQRLPRERPAEQCVELRHVALPQEVAVLPSNHRGRGITQVALCRLVPHQDVGIGVNDHDREGRRLEHRLQELRRLTQAILDPLPLPDLCLDLVGEPGKCGRA
jgi:hypothetical protein